MLGSMMGSGIGGGGGQKNGDSDGSELQLSHHRSQSSHTVSTQRLPVRNPRQNPVRHLTVSQRNQSAKRRYQRGCSKVSGQNTSGSAPVQESACSVSHDSADYFRGGRVGHGAPTCSDLVCKI